MSRFLSSNIAILLVLNIGFALVVEALIAPYRFQPSAPDFEALRTYRNLLFPAMAVMIYTHIHLGYARPKWRAVYYGLGFANYMAYTGYGALGPLTTSIWLVYFA